MRYYLDTEFIERGYRHPIEFISIGLVREDGAELYAVAADGWDETHASDWVRANVLPHLGSEPRLARHAIAERVLAFVRADASPEFWGYYADYDWVVFCQLFGAMIDLPKGWPMFCRDIIQLCKGLGNPKLPESPAPAHNALADARHHRAMHDFLMERASAAAPR